MSSPRNGPQGSSHQQPVVLSNAKTEASAIVQPPSPQQSQYANSQVSGQYYGQEYNNMSHSQNQQPYMDPYGHMSTVQQQQPPPQTATSGSLVSYGSQAPMLQAPPVYHSSQGHYQSYGQNNSHVDYSVSQAMVPHSQPMQLPSNAVTLPSSTVGSNPKYDDPMFDTTGQIAPAGVKPRVTATLWEDEGSLCFQVEAKGICVARREDNHMINGTKLLNVAGMTRGRRDGILKSEKQRHVVKIGPMHLKGVWIPFERALEFANKEKITELLYPLFVHQISQLLYHPTNTNRTNQVMQAASQRQREQRDSIRSQQLTAPLSSHPNATRPPIDRAHTFPTPPTSTTSSISISNHDNYWNQPSMMPSSHPTGAQPLTIDAGLSNARSLPSTPATTPPGHAVPSFSQGQTVPSNIVYSHMQSYDNSRPAYPAAQNAQASYPPHDMHYASMKSAYIKNEMAPPAREHLEGSDDKVQGHHEEDEAEHEAVHDDEYERPHYNAPRGYAYNGIGTEQHVQQSVTDSPSNQPANQTQWMPRNGYHTPPRVPSAGSVPSKMYAPSTDPYAQTVNMNTYATPPLTNGSGSSKRRREDDDDDQDAGHSIDGEDGLKRRKTIHEGTPSMSLSGPNQLNRARSQVTRRR